MNELERQVFEMVLTEEERAVWNRRLIGDYISPDALWACTTCGACMQECPVNIEHVPAIVAMRQSLVMMEASFNEESSLLPTVYANLETNAVPWGGMAQSDRAAWAEDLGIKSAAEDSTMDVLFGLAVPEVTMNEQNVSPGRLQSLCSMPALNFAS